MVNSERISCVICSKPVEPKRDIFKNAPTTQQFEATQSATLRCFNFRRQPYVGSTYISSFSQDSEIRSTGIYCTGCGKWNRELLQLLQELISVEDRIESVMKNVKSEFNKSMECLQLEELEQLISLTQGNQKKICQLRFELVKSPEINLRSLHGKISLAKQVDSAPSRLELEESTVCDSTRNKEFRKISPDIPHQDDSNSFCGADDDVMDHFEDDHADDTEEPAKLSSFQPRRGIPAKTASESILLEKFGISESFVQLQPLSDRLLKSLGVKKDRSYPCLFGDCRFATRSFGLLDRNKHLTDVHNLSETDIVALDAITQNPADEEPEPAPAPGSDEDENCSSDDENEYAWISACILEDCTVDDFDAYMKKKNIRVKGYKNRNSLLAHLQKRHGLTLLKEELIELMKERRGKMNKRLISLKPRFYPCWLADCPATELRSKAELDQHMEEAHSNLPSTKVRKTICKVWACNLRFLSVEERDEHIREIHDGLDSYVSCPFGGCQFFLPSAEALQVHLRENHKEKRHICPFCKTPFLTAMNLDKHISKKHFNKRYTCLYMECTESFETVNERDAHIGAAHGSTAGFVRCLIGCRRRFPTQEDLDQHKQLRHRLRKDLPCPICGFKFISQLMLDRHVKAHAPGDAEKFKNRKPTKKSNPDRRKRQFRTYPEREYTASGKLKRIRDPKKKLWYYCDICDEECRTENDLRHHKATVHLKYQCDACGAAFKCHSGLFYHVKAFHEKKFQNVCELCGKSFLRPSQRDMHYKSVHLGERKFVCDICGKNYSASSNLRYHKVKHHGLPSTKRGPMPRYDKRPQDYRYPIAAASARRKAEAAAADATETGSNNQNAASNQPKEKTKVAKKVPSATASTSTSSFSDDHAIPIPSTSAGEYIPNGSQYFHQGPQQPTYSSVPAFQPQEINYQQLNYMMQHPGYPYNVPQ